MISIYTESLISLLNAYRIKLINGPGDLRLPAVNRDRHISEQQTEAVIARVDALLSTLLKTRHYCFYRSFVLACVLRKRGVALIMNIGLRNFQHKQGLSGHCWLSVEGHPFAVQNHNHQHYKTQLGAGENGVTYWVGSNDPVDMQRVKVNGFEAPGSRLG